LNPEGGSSKFINIRVSLQDYMMSQARRPSFGVPYPFERLQVCYCSPDMFVDIKVLQNLRHQERLKDKAAFLNMREVLGVLQLFHVTCHSSFLYDIHSVFRFC
jgi:hypothetical protein